MRDLVATYRLQFRNGMDLARAAELSDYLKTLGASHLYASPIFAAAPASTHGYDVTDHGRIDESLGGAARFDRLTRALEKEGLGLILDIVPNHMAARPENDWWRDVLEWGPGSIHAETFDIDWTAPRLILPVLGAPYGEVVAAGELALRFDAQAGRILMAYYDTATPLAPPSYAEIFARISAGGFADIARRFSRSTPDDVAEARARLRAAVDGLSVDRFNAELARLDAEPGLMHALHEMQHWRLAWWRLGREALTYRRFFEITGLAGVRVEEPRVFDAVHELALGLVRTGKVDGLRIDHVDGLADPTGYLERLAAAVEGHARIWVEKILEGPEQLRPDWPVCGTTGYEFIADLAGLLTDPAGEDAFERAYRTFLAGDCPHADETTIKRRILTRNLATELSELVKRARELASADPAMRDFGPDTLREAIVALMASLPVYRTYIDRSGVTDTDRAIVRAAAGRAKRRADLEDTRPVDAIAGILTGDVASDLRGAQEDFVRRFQQTSGPVMAKAVEDTLFYRANRLVGLNEVGGDPGRFGAPVAAFHERMKERAARQPLGLSATATHDTKRGEDARARLYVLSERPDDWERIVGLLADRMRPFRSTLDDGPAPEPNVEWMIYQAAFGGWPAGLSPEDEDGLDAYARRLGDFALKAVREAKLRTSWTDPDEEYENAVRHFAAQLLNSATGAAQHAHALFAPLFTAGALNGLVQTLLKVAAPGVPDIYQGCEVWDFSFVDPDNRRPVDFPSLAETARGVMAEPVEALLGDWISGRIKLRVLMAGLAARRRFPYLFSAGDYQPLRIIGRRARNVVAFCRADGHAHALALAPVRADFASLPDKPRIEPAFWEDTTLLLGPVMPSGVMDEMISGRKVSLSHEPRVADLLADVPVALFLPAT